MKSPVPHTAGVTVFDRIVQQVRDIKDEAREFGRDIEVFTQGQVICRPTQTQAEDYHHHANVENADWPAIEQMLALKNITPQNTAADEYSAKRSLQAASGIGAIRSLERRTGSPRSSPPSAVPACAALQSPS